MPRLDGIIELTAGEEELSRAEPPETRAQRFVAALRGLSVDTIHCFDLRDSSSPPRYREVELGPEPEPQDVTPTSLPALLVKHIRDNCPMYFGLCLMAEVLGQLVALPDILS